MFAMAQESCFFPEAGEPDQIMQVLIEVNTRVQLTAETFEMLQGIKSVAVKVFPK